MLKKYNLLLVLPLLISSIAVADANQVSNLERFKAFGTNSLATCVKFATEHKPNWLKKPDFSNVSVPSIDEAKQTVVAYVEDMTPEQIRAAKISGGVLAGVAALGVVYKVYRYFKPASQK